jgi:hypothetical protein
MAKKLTLNDIFNDDDFGLLDLTAEVSTLKTDDKRLIDSFAEINDFFDKHNKEPNSSSMSEYALMARLKNFQDNDTQKQILKPFDKHNLLGFVTDDNSSINDVLNDNDAFGLLNSDDDLDIFKIKHIAKIEDRIGTDFVAKRKPIKEEEFKKYEVLFQKVHKQLKQGKRQIKPFKNAENFLEEGRYYILDGILLFLEKANFDRNQKNQAKNTLRRKDGRTKIIFENATSSDMLYRSLGKALHNNGQMITNINEPYNADIFVSPDDIKQQDKPLGWIYILKSKSSNPKIANIKDLHKIGFSSVAVNARIKNAKNEATYLFSEVEEIATYKIYNRDANKLENLLHRFFANACLDIDLYNEKGQRFNPREWFVVPIEVINQAIDLILKGDIVNYKYNAKYQTINKYQ